ncbi:hypothetical protein CEXT_810411 [Caerostris extrusa]|uniref:Uncharacterized protein n=1 Tax=Caerostris extrusa TaxID=172846 RepID=A0AAV4WS22_CAEEX|nr:hypothetical protein CEXT_810411 [Caerostris extrusa]
MICSPIKAAVQKEEDKVPRHLTVQEVVLFIANLFNQKRSEARWVFKQTWTNTTEALQGQLFHTKIWNISAANRDGGLTWLNTTTDAINDKNDASSNCKIVLTLVMVLSLKSQPQLRPIMETPAFPSVVTWSQNITTAAFFVHRTRFVKFFIC